MLDIVRDRASDDAIYTFEWQGEEYLIDYSYDNVLRWFDLISKQDLPEPIKVLHSFSMFIGDGLNVPIETQSKIVQQISDSIAESPYDFSSGGQRVLDYSQDSEAIYASFLKEYGIDLIDEKARLDYFKFRALLSNLSDKAPIKEIMRIRSENPAKYVQDNPEYANALVQQQNDYAIKMTDEQREQERQNQLDNALKDL